MTFDAPTLTPIAEEVLRRRYLIKDTEGNPIEGPKALFWRVARTIAEEDRKYKPINESDEEEDRRIDNLALEFYNLMASGRWLPNSPTLMNAGRPLGQLSACFVLPVEDALSNGKDGIYDTLTAMALIHQSGGGTGFSFSRLRPAGSIVRSTTGVASGPVSFMSLYDASTEVVKQGGTRRGANMGILHVGHPDILEFVDCKKDTGSITNFNISVAVTDSFMSDVLMGKPSATKLWERICENAWQTGEPGLFFIDEANRHNPVPHLGEYEATNPCGEQPLLPYDVCNLGSLNLSKYVEDGSGNILWDQMGRDIVLSMRFLDNVIDANKYPLPQIEDLAKRIRRVGNGVMGWADMLLKMGIRYDSDLAIDTAREVANFFVSACQGASLQLADERGVFPEWENSVWGPRGRNLRQRNCNVTTVAPTGTISMIAGCSSGVEPIFAWKIHRNQAGTKFVDVHPLAREYGDGNLPSHFVTTGEIAPEWHVKMQAAWQAYICSAISKTINLPASATVDDVAKAYMMAYNSGCKGITVYRDGSRPGQVLSTGDRDGRAGEDGERRENAGAARAFGKRKRPEVLDGRTHGIDSPIGRMHVVVNRDDEGRPFEVFLIVGKAGGTTFSFAEALGRLISLCLRYGIEIKEVHKQLRGISSDRSFGFGNGKVASGPDAVAQVLEAYMDGNKESGNGFDFGACPDYHAELVFEEGCYKCHACGYTGCG